ncbi:MAG: heavy-metal-associated domain-containing protein [Ginsengibacter sp.]
MKNIIFIFLLLCAAVTNAQVKKVSIQASGLTCSMCSNAIFKALKSVDFVEKVDANIKNSTFEITFKPNADVDFDKLKNKVEGAGFFVAGFWATVHFDNLKIKNDAPVESIGKNLMFLHVADQELNGDKTVKFLDKGYTSAKEYKKNSTLTTKECYKTGIADATCIDSGISKGSRIYHVTI